MDAGLSYNQGMVVGKYHTKALLPGILGARTKVKTSDGNTFIRSDDLLKSLGWQETEIRDLVRYTDYENALTHARVLSLSGLGPEKANLQSSLFKVVARVIKFNDGDTFDVEDVISGATFTVRFDGINTGETSPMKVGSIPNQPGGDVNDPFGNTTTITPISTPGGRAMLYTEEKIRNRVFILRMKLTNRASKEVIFEAQFEPGATENTIENYTKDIYDRFLATVWYYQPESTINTIKDFVNQCFILNRGKTIVTTDMDNAVTKEFFGKDFPGLGSVYKESPIFIKRSNIFDKIKSLDIQHAPPSSLSISALDDYGIPEQEFNRFYNDLVCFKILGAMYTMQRTEGQKVQVTPSSKSPWATMGSLTQCRPGM